LSRPTISVTGATGFIGRHLLGFLANRSDVTVRALVHGTREAALPGSARLTWVRGDLADTASLRELLRPGNDLVDLAFPQDWSQEQHLTAAHGLARVAVDAGTRRVIHCSTAVVAGRAREYRVTESTRPCPVTKYERTKLALENVWREVCGDRVELAILRPTVVFGPGGRNLLKLATDLTAGNRAVNYLRSSLLRRRRMNLVPVENVIAAIVFLLDRRESPRSDVYIVSDDDDPANNFRDVERILMQAFGIPDYPLPLLPAPRPLLSALLRLLGRAEPHRIYDASRLKRAGLHDKARSLERALREFAASHVSTVRAPSREQA
jgi:nucleoside-diphosphate-sugar epimerase